MYSWVDKWLYRYYNIDKKERLKKYRIWKGRAYEYYGMHREFLPPERVACSGGAAGEADPCARIEGRNRTLRLILHGKMPNGRERAARRRIFLPRAGGYGAILCANRSSDDCENKTRTGRNTETVISNWMDKHHV